MKKCIKTGHNKDKKTVNKTHGEHHGKWINVNKYKINYAYHEINYLINIKSFNKRQRYLNHFESDNTNESDSEYKQIKVVRVIRPAT